jgi:hypothetical protein
MAKVRPTKATLGSEEECQLVLKTLNSQGLPALNFHQTGMTIATHYRSNHRQPSPGTVQSIQLTGNNRSLALRNSSLTVQAADGPDALWIGSIDSIEGYNVVLTLNTAAPLLEPSGTGDPLTMGWYTIVVKFSGGAVQEFSLSLRD